MADPILRCHSEVERPCSDPRSFDLCRLQVYPRSRTLGIAEEIVWRWFHFSSPGWCLLADIHRALMSRRSDCLCATASVRA